MKEWSRAKKLSYLIRKLKPRKDKNPPFLHYDFLLQILEEQLTSETKYYLDFGEAVVLLYKGECLMRSDWAEGTKYGKFLKVCGNKLYLCNNLDLTQTPYKITYEDIKGEWKVTKAKNHTRYAKRNNTDSER